MRIIKSYFSLFVLFTVCIISLNAQEIDTARAKGDSLLNKITNIDAKLKQISTKDTTKGFSAPLVIDTAYLNDILEESMKPLRDENGLLLFDHEWTPFDANVSFRDTVILEPAFLPVVFDGKIIPSDLKFEKKDSIKRNNEFRLIAPDQTFEKDLEKVDQIQNIRRKYYMANPQKVKLNALEFGEGPVIKQDIVKKKSPFEELLSADNTIDIAAPNIEKTSIKSIYWIKNGSHRLDLGQHNFSEHWPGDNFFNLKSEHKINLNYRKKKVYWNNLIEWRLSLQRVKPKEEEEGDAKRRDVNVLDDQLRTYSNFGIDAFKNWSYSSSLELKTPLFNKFSGDTRQRAFLSPFELNLGVGMTYNKEIVSKVDKYRKFNVSISLPLLSLNYKNVKSDMVDVGQFGIEEGYSSKLDYGSTINLNLSYSRNRYTNFTSRVHYFTNYDRVYMEWENNLNFKLNSYFSTSVYFYLKFDDAVSGRNQSTDRWARYFSYYQTLGFGLYYNW